MKQVDYLIIGAGSAGLTVAVGLAKLRKNVLVVSENIGGECTHSGCVPSKRFLFLAKQYMDSSDASYKKALRQDVFRRIRAKIQEIERHDAAFIEDNNIPFIKGRASFVNKHTIDIIEAGGKKRRTVSFRKAIIATGSAPFTIPVEGLPTEKIITNDALFELKELPESIVIFGGGPIGAEMATAFAKMGTVVTMVIRSQLIPVEPDEMVAVVRQQLEKLDVKIYEGVKDQTFDHEKHELVLYGTGKKQSERGQVLARIPESDTYLMALGRVPNIYGLQLEKAGVDYDKTGIRVDTNLQTSQRHIYALGDVIHEAKFTHLAYDQAKYLVSQAIFPHINRKITALPAVTFTDPPISSVGELHEDYPSGSESKLTGGFIKKYEVNFNESDRGKIEERTQMFGNFYVNMLNGRITGASIVGHFGEHAINMVTLAINKKATVFDLGTLITPYPTYINSINGLYTRFVSDFVTDIRWNILKFLFQQKTRILAVVFWLGTGLTLYWYLRSLEFNTRLLAEQLYNLFMSPFGVLLFVLVYMLRATISFSAVVLSLLSGVIYGFWGGLILTIIASNLSSVVAYFLGSTVFGKVEVQQRKSRAGADRVGGVREFIKKNAFEAILVLRLAAFPYDLLSYIAGGVRAPFVPFILATAIGSLPGSIAIVSIGASVENIRDIENVSIDPIYLIGGVILMAFSILVSQVVKRLRKEV